MGNARTSDNDSLCRAGVSIKELDDLSNDQRKKSEAGRLEQLPKVERRSSIPLECINARLDSIKRRRCCGLLSRIASLAVVVCE
jgi:hypothetical protein